MIFFAVLAFAIGALTATVEILSRYRDEPFKTLSGSGFSWLYLVLNGLLGLAAFLIILATAADDATFSSLEYLQHAVTGGIGAAVVIRTRVVSVNVDGKEVPIGPGYVVDQFLGILDRQIDRARAIQRVKTVSDRMQTKDGKVPRDELPKEFFERLAAHFETTVPGSMQNLSEGEKAAFAAKIEQIRNNNEVPFQYRLMSLGFTVLDLIGEEMFMVLMDNIPAAPPAPSPLPSQPPADEDSDAADMSFTAPEPPPLSTDDKARRAKERKAARDKFLQTGITSNDAIAKLMKHRAASRLDEDAWQKLLDASRRIVTSEEEDAVRLNKFAILVQRRVDEAFFAEHFVPVD